MKRSHCCSFAFLNYFGQRNQDKDHESADHNNLPSPRRSATRGTDSRTIIQLPSFARSSTQPLVHEAQLPWTINHDRPDQSSSPTNFRRESAITPSKDFFEDMTTNMSYANQNSTTINDLDGPKGTECFDNMVPTTEPPNEGPSFRSPVRANTLSPQFKNVRIIVITTLNHGKIRKKDERVLDLYKDVNIQKNYGLIENTKHFADSVCDRDEELFLDEGSCKFSCSCKSRCNVSKRSRALENLEDWEEVEATTASFEAEGHDNPTITITRKLGITRRLETLKIPRGPFTNWFRKELNKAMESTQAGGTKRLTYFAKPELIRLTPRPIIRKLVLDEAANFSFSMDDVANRMKLADRIYRDAPILFLILLHELGDSSSTYQILEGFLTHQETGNILLPLKESPPEWIDAKLEAEYNRCYLRQWPFQAAVFSRDTGFEVQRLDPNIIIPFLSKENISRHSYSSVYRVRLDSRHQDLYHLPEDSNPELAVKVVPKHSKAGGKAVTSEAVRNEQLILKGLQELNDDHIIELLATFHQGEECHFIFPLANSNLDEFMKVDPDGFRSPDTKKHQDFLAWMWNQMKGIAYGIHRIHNFKPQREPQITPKYLDPELKGKVTTVATGYHHDIKPQNILYFEKNKIKLESDVPSEGIFQIADFGLGKFHTSMKDTTTRGTQHFHGTITYAAPERMYSSVSRTAEDERKQPRPELKLSRPYDIWCFGCVLMEVLVWIVFGSEGRKSFESEREGSAEEGKNEYTNDAFFHLAEDGFLKLRPSVKVRLEELCTHPRIANYKGGSLDRALNLVRRLLKIEAKERPIALEVFESLKEIAAAAEKEAGMLVTVPEEPTHELPIPSIVATDAEEVMAQLNANLQDTSLGPDTTGSETPRLLNRNERSDTTLALKYESSSSSADDQSSISGSSDQQSLYAL